MGVAEAAGGFPTAPACLTPAGLKPACVVCGTAVDPPPAAAAARGLFAVGGVEGRGTHPLLYKDPPLPVDPTPLLLFEEAAAAAAAAAMAPRVDVDPPQTNCLAPRDPDMGSGALAVIGTW